jgi:hypothetical protein
VPVELRRADQARDRGSTLGEPANISMIYRCLIRTTRIDPFPSVELTRFQRPVFDVKPSPGMVIRPGMNRCR